MGIILSRLECINITKLKYVYLWCNQCLIVAWWCHMALYNLVNICSFNGLLHGRTKPSLNQYWLISKTLIWQQYHQRYPIHQSLKFVWKFLMWNFIQISEGSMTWFHRLSTALTAIAFLKLFDINRKLCTYIEINLEKVKDIYRHINTI